MLWGLLIRHKESRTREEYGARKVLGPESFLEEKFSTAGLLMWLASPLINTDQSRERQVAWSFSQSLAQPATECGLDLGFFDLEEIGCVVLSLPAPFHLEIRTE